MHAVVLESGVGEVDFVRRVLRSVEYAPQVTGVPDTHGLLQVVGDADLVLAPWSLPDMLFRRFRYQLDALGWEGTLAATASNHGEIQRALRAGAHFGLKRPLDEQTLVRALHHFRLVEAVGPIPMVEELEDSWSIALRRPFELSFTARPIDVEQPGAIWLAEYAPLGSDEVTAVTLLDDELGFGLGAAVSLLPPSLRREALRRREASARLTQNLQMVCELLVDLYHAPNPLQMRRLRRTSRLHRNLRRRLHPGNRLDVEVDLRDYGRGRATFAQLEGDASGRRPRPAPQRVVAPARHAAGRFL